jgi:hypothetical protein
VLELVECNHAWQAIYLHVLFLLRVLSAAAAAT